MELSVVGLASPLPSVSRRGASIRPLVITNAISPPLQQNDPMSTKTTPALIVAWLRAQWATRPGAVATAAVVGLALPGLVPLGLESYHGYLALGRGGLPYNVWGWLLQGLVQLVAARDTVGTAPFALPTHASRYGARGRTSHLPGQALPARAGPRPIVPGYVAPQRQITDPPPRAVPMAMHNFLRDLVAANAGILALRPSALEGVGSEAVWLREKGAAAPGLESTKGELCHVHAEGSSHMTLSLVDAEDAVAKGWAERHRLSGVLGYLPISYVLVYAPRNDEELEVWKRLVLASVRFAYAGDREVEAVE